MHVEFQGLTAGWTVAKRQSSRVQFYVNGWPIELWTARGELVQLLHRFARHRCAAAPATNP